MTISYGQHVSRALLDWCDETLKELKRPSKSIDESGKQERRKRRG